MTDLPPDRNAKKDPNPAAGARRGSGSITGTPRWVQVFGIIAIALVLVFVTTHLAGGGMGSHTP